ncbi:MAG: hypothetical protein AB7O37_23320 [Vicinamibacteria bacterium]
MKRTHHGRDERRAEGSRTGPAHEADRPAWAQQLDQLYGRLGWSQGVERCTSSVWSVPLAGGLGYVAFAAVTASVSVGPPRAPLATRQETGHHESSPQESAGPAVALAERAAVADALARCARALLDGAPPAPSPAPSPRGSQEDGDPTPPLPSALTDVALLQEDEPVSAELMNQLWRTARHLHGREGANALWADLDLASDQPPLGRHALRLAQLLDLDPCTRGASCPL